MRKYLIAAAAAALFALPLPTSAAPVSTEVSAQTVVVSPRGVGIRDGHSRFESRDRRGMRRERSRCRTEVRRVERRGRTVTTRSRVCD